jgi:hypothetical protein
VIDDPRRWWHSRSAATLLVELAGLESPPKNGRNGEGFDTPGPVGGLSHQYTIRARLCGCARASSSAAIALVAHLYASLPAVSLRVARTVTPLRAER